MYRWPGPVLVAGGAGRGREGGAGGGGAGHDARLHALPLGTAVLEPDLKEEGQSAETTALTARSRSADQQRC